LSVALIVPSTVLPPGPLAAYLKVVIDAPGFFSGVQFVFHGHAQDFLE
jgi:hypothetical protein